MASSYSKFTYDDLDTLGIEIERTKLFDKVEPKQPTAWLADTLKFNNSLPLATEKAKSELIIVPILTDTIRRNNFAFTYFSGYNFDVDKSRGLKGHCDFLLSRKPHSPRIEAPVFCIVEAKNDNFDLGIPQCVAQMYAAFLFNQKKNQTEKCVYGAVTLGFNWLFLKLENAKVWQDEDLYGTQNLPELLGVIDQIVNS